ncbi:hypothetical protein XENTR_v10009413 [Xenopus tropicalis]|nr:hypothetical protein XENTR_v10009413 [Xenopus tropicalis]
MVFMPGEYCLHLDFPLGFAWRHRSLCLICGKQFMDLLQSIVPLLSPHIFPLFTASLLSWSLLLTYCHQAFSTNLFFVPVQKRGMTKIYAYKTKWLGGHEGSLGVFLMSWWAVTKLYLCTMNSILYINGRGHIYKFEGEIIFTQRIE